MADTVMIACKHPQGVVLNTDKYVLAREGDPSSPLRKVHGRSFKLSGWAHEYNKPDPAAETGGYVLTPVPSDFWEEWLASHKDFPMLMDKTILPPAKVGSGLAQARDHEAVPKMFAPSSGELKALQSAQLVKD
jgi:hypothetical protein